MSDPVTVRVTVNGVAHTGRCEPRKLLVDFLREDLGLTGTHVGCEHGVCGACTILFNGEAARSCITAGSIRCRRRSASITAYSAAFALRACS